MSVSIERLVNISADDLKKILKAFGNTRAYWCKNCEEHVINGHKKDCIVIKTAIGCFGKKWTRNNIQSNEDWKNYLEICKNSEKC